VVFVPVIIVIVAILAIAGTLYSVHLRQQSSAASAQRTPDSVGAAAPAQPSGKLVVAVNVPYAPSEFKNPSGKIVGFDIDLMQAVAKALGLTVDYRESDFSKIIPSVTGGPFDVGMSAITDTKEREQTADFVTYFSAGILWAQKPGAGIDPNNACGKKVAVQATTTEETDELPAKSKACTDAGKPAIDILKFDGEDVATNAVVLGQADAMSADSSVTAYAIKLSGGQLEAAGEIADAAPYGWAVAKGSPLAESLQKALEQLIQTGEYRMILTKWGEESGAIKEPVINGAVS
jgi:polar amino acid transport system substrate-binding protein